MAFLLLPSAFGQTGELTFEDRSFIEAHFRAAKRAEAVQQYDTAAREYSLIVEKFPTAMPRVYQNLGLVYYAQRNYEDAIEAFEKGINLEPDMAGARLFLGSSYLLTAQAEKALPHLQFVHRAQPTADSATYLGQAYLAHLRFAEAAAAFRGALEGADQKDQLLYLVGKSYLKLAERIGNAQSKRHPGSKHVVVASARIFENQKAYQIAAIKYLEAAQLDPTNAAIFYPLAHMLAILGLDEASNLALERYRLLVPNDRSAAIDRDDLPKEQIAEIGTRVDFEGVLRSLPSVEEPLPLLPMLSSDANAALREVLASDERKQWKTVVSHLAAARLDDAVEALPVIQSEVHGWLRDYLEATVQVWLSDLDRAEQIANRENLASSSSPMVQLLRAEIYHDLSLQFFGRLLEEYPGSCLSHLVRGQNLAAQENPAAEAEFRKALDGCPNQTQIRIALADFYLSNSRYNEALKESLDELDLDPYSHLAKTRIGRIYIQLRDPENGMPFLKEALAVDPDDANARTDLARGYELLGEWERAVGEYERALEADPSINRIHYVLGRIYRRLGKKELADREYEIFQANEAKEREQHVERIQRLRRQEADSAASPPK